MSNRLFRRRHEGHLSYRLRTLRHACLPWLIAGMIFLFYVLMAYLELNRGNP